MRRVIIESPYAGNISDNLDYLRRCLRDSIDRGEAPLASHLLYPFVLREDLKDERQLGIELGYEWWKAASKIVFYMDYGCSPGMQKALARARLQGKTIEFRTLAPGFPWWNRVESTGWLGSLWRRLWYWWFGVSPQPAALRISQRYTDLAPDAGTTGQLARQEAKTPAEKSEPENEAEPSLGEFINQTLARDAPSPVPWGEPLGRLK